MKGILLIVYFLIITVLNSGGQIINTFAGSSGTGSFGDGGAATIARLLTPSGVAVDRAGNVYIADQNNKVIRKVDITGIITTFAGNTIAGYSGDGGMATDAQLYYPTGVTVDQMGNVFIADEFNNVIRKVTPDGIISTCAGNNTIGYSGDGGPATSAQFWHPADVGVDSIGNIYIAEEDNSVIRKVNTSGIISTIAGIGGVPGYSGDGGPGTNAKLNFPQGIAVDKSGNVYVADFYNSRIRRIDAATGKISTIAGNGGGGFSGDGGIATNAQLYDAAAVAIDKQGNIYISDYYNSRIRKVYANGLINTIVGSDTAGFSGDGGAATMAQINYPEGVAVNDSGVVYIADYNNARVRIVTNIPDTLLPLSVHSISLPIEAEVLPNPNKGVFHLNISDIGMVNTYEVFNDNGEMVGEGFIYSKSQEIRLKNKARGEYFITLMNRRNSTTVKFLVVE